MKLNFGGGTKKLKGYVNIDNNPNVKPDILADLMEPLPFEDNSVDEILCWNVMEHLPGLGPLNLLKEVYRILKPGGKFKFRVPMACTMTAHIVIDHVSQFTPRSFESKPLYGYKFKRNIKVTLPIFHFLKFPEWCFYVNYVFPLFTGIEGTIIKEELK